MAWPWALQGGPVMRAQPNVILMTLMSVVAHDQPNIILMKLVLGVTHDQPNVIFMTLVIEQPECLYGGSVGDWALNLLAWLWAL